MTFAYHTISGIFGRLIIDNRKNSSLGYTTENVQWVHKDINRMKSDFSDNYFIEMCSNVALQKGQS